MKNSQRLFEPNTRPFVFFLIVFAVATLVTKNFYLAAAEGVVILALIIYSLIMRSRRRKALLAYIESVTYDAETAKNNTLLNFPLPIVVFRLDDSRIIGETRCFLHKRPVRHENGYKPCRAYTGVFGQVAHGGQDTKSGSF